MTQLSSMWTAESTKLGIGTAIFVDISAHFNRMNWNRRLTMISGTARLFIENLRFPTRHIFSPDERVNRFYLRG